MQEPATTDPVETPPIQTPPTPPPTGSPPTDESPTDESPTGRPSTAPSPTGPSHPDPLVRVRPRVGRHSAYLAFVAAALRSPGKVGAVLPSSGKVAELLATIVPRTGAPVVVELGPGTGAVTGVIDARLPPDARHLAVELDPGMVRYLRRAHPGLEVIEGDAAKLGTLLAERGVESADAVLSGLPWALFDDDLQRSILEQVAAAIGPTGAFTTFAYTSGLVLPAARRFRRALRATFDEVVVSATEWRNVPPAFAYVCRRPRAG